MSNLVGHVPMRAAARPVASRAEGPHHANRYPAASISMERRGGKLTLQVPGGLMALGGATVLAFSLLSTGAPGAIVSRMSMTPLLMGGLLVGGGAAAVFGAELVPPKSRHALASDIPTAAIASKVAATFPQSTEVVRDEAGRFAVLEKRVG